MAQAHPGAGDQPPYQGQYLDRQLGNYTLIKLLGMGSFAEVYLGEHIYLHDHAAIKVLTVRLTNEEIDKFLQEARTTRNLRHPHIIQILEFGMEGRLPFIIMDYAPDGSLRKRHPWGTRLPLSTVVPYVKHIATGLQFAHDQKLVHRDIKPDNILLGRNNQLLIGDFGTVTTSYTADRQKTQDIIGTWAYMSPEQINGTPRSASDQYSLGIVVYEWLSGALPFQGNIGQLTHQHLFVAPPSLCAILPALSPRVEQVIMRALAKDPNQRFPSIQEFANALEAASQSPPADTTLLTDASRPSSASLDQLWYTWSPLGLGVTTGFRVRAASRDLLDTQSSRFKTLNQYQHYVLPQGVDAFAIPLEKTPTCLALLDTGSERILVQKRYIGKDLVGHPGVFFSHLLAGLPVHFSAREAIALWQSSFWKTDDRSLNPSNTLELPTVSRQELQSYAASAQTNLLATMNRADIEKYLPLMIQAFLTYETHLKLYLAAPPEMTAALIWGLTHSLPISLLQGLTFSTYEHDLKNGTGLIVGTCWLSARGDPPPAPQRLPAFCTEGTNLAINSYTGECSQLSKDNARASFAEFATRYWLGSPQDRLDELLATAEQLAISNTDAFLTLYKFFTAQSLTQDGMIHFLQTPMLVAELLERENIQNTLIELMLTSPQWWKEHGERDRQLTHPNPDSSGNGSLQPGQKCSDENHGGS